MNALRVVDVSADRNPQIMRDATKVILENLTYVGMPYVHDEAEIERRIRQSAFKGETHHALIGPGGEIIGVAVHVFDDVANALVVKEMAIVRTCQRAREERYGTRLMLGVAAVALRQGIPNICLSSRSDSLEFYKKLGLEMVDDRQRTMVGGAQQLHDRFPELAGADSIRVE